MIQQRKSILTFVFTFALLTLIILLFDQGPILGDDIWGATSILGNPIQSIAFTLRWDVHPPIYYSLLDIWAIFGKSDTWLRLSSAATHAALVALVFNYVKNRESLTAAVFSALIVFSTPLLLDYSTEIRMYALISLFSFLIFYASRCYLEENDERYFKWIFLVGVLLTNTHAIGILFVFFHYLYGAVNLRKSLAPLFKWSILNALIALTAIPAIANSAFKTATHAAQPNFSEVLSLFQNLFVSGPAFFIMLAIVLVILVARNPSNRTMVACYLLAPLALFSIISYSVKPLWLERNFVFLLPIFAVLLGTEIARLPYSKAAKSTIVAAIVGFNFLQWDIWQEPLHERAFGQTLSAIEQSTKSHEGLVCIVTENPLKTFWELQRYLNDPEWGNPLEIQPPINERWTAIGERLPEFARSILELEERPNFTESADYVLVSNSRDRCNQSDIVRTLIVTDGIRIDGLEEVLRNDYYAIYRD